MDNRWKHSLDTYITSGRYRESRVWITCKECEQEFEWRICYEYGRSWYEPEDVICPNCKTEYYEED